MKWSSSLPRLVFFRYLDDLGYLWGIFYSPGKPGLSTGILYLYLGRWTFSWSIIWPERSTP